MNDPKVMLRYIDDEGHMITLHDDYAEQAPKVALAPTPSPDHADFASATASTSKAARGLRRQLFGREQPMTLTEKMVKTVKEIRDAEPAPPPQRLAAKFALGDKVRVVCGCAARNRPCVHEGKIATVTHVFGRWDENEMQDYGLAFGESPNIDGQFAEEMLASTDAPYDPPPAPRPHPRCLRCGAPSYVGLFSTECLRPGGCRTAEERAGEPTVGTERHPDGEPTRASMNCDVWLGRRGDGEPVWVIPNAPTTACYFATRELAVTAWKTKRAADYRCADEANWTSGAWPKPVPTKGSPPEKPNPLLSAITDPTKGPENNDPMAAYMPYLR